MSGVRVLVGTRKGAFVLTSDAKRSQWDVSGPHFGGWEIYHVAGSPADPNRLYASQSTGWFGQLIQRSNDGGETWEPVGNQFGYDGDPGSHLWYDGTPHPWEFARVWHLEPSPTDPDTVYAGVEDAALFRSGDGGQTWQELPALRGHDSGPSWQPGAGGLILHTIVPHPTDAQRVWVGISAVGVFETRDGGVTWEPRNKGVRADFMPGPEPVTGQCVHKFAMAAGEPETLYQQNHCGQYRSTDGGLQWTDLSHNGVPSQFGFPLVAHPRDAKTFWVIPLTQPEEGRFMPDASAAVWRTTDRGETFTRGDRGLPQEDAYLSVLREAMARDTLDPVGVTFGTKTGQLWHSSDEGGSWRLVTGNLPEIWAVEAVVRES